MLIESRDDHTWIMPAASDRKALGEIVARARSLPIYAAVQAVPAMRQAAIDFASSPLARLSIAGVATREVSAAGVSAMEFLWPADPRPTSTLFFHGGGFVCGSIAAARGLISGLCAALNRSVIAVAYRQGPEHPFPAAIEDARSAFAWLSTRCAQPITLIGESAGALLACNAALYAKTQGLEPARAVIALSPWFDLAMDGDSWRENAARDVVSTTMGELFRDCYLGGQDPHALGVTPLDADMRGAPPLLIQVGSHEMALDDARTLARHARAAGVSTTIEIYAEMPHGFIKFAGSVGTLALERVAAWESRLAKGSA